VPVDVSFAAIAEKILAAQSRTYADRLRELSTPTRRDFLVGAGLAGLAATTIDGAFGNDLFVTTTRRTFAIAYRGRQWTLERGALGPHTSVRHSRQRDTHEIELVDAVWPGTSVDCHIHIVLRQARNGTWEVSLKWETQKTSFQMPLHEWLLRTPSKPVALSNLAEIPLGREGRLRLSKGSLWSLDSDWTWKLIAKAGELEGLQARRRVRFDTVTVTTLPSESLEVAELLRGARPAFVTRLRLSIASRRGLALLAWEGANGVEAELRLDSPKTCDVFAITAQSRALVRADASAAIEIRSANKVRPRILLERAVVAGTLGGKVTRIGLAGRLARKAQSVDLGAGIVTIAGQDEHPISLSLHEGRSTLQIQSLLYGLALPIDGADFAELKCGALPAEISIGGSEENAGTDEISIGAGKPPRPRIIFRPAANNRSAADIKLPLDRCELRLLRGRDLLNVTFTFRHISLASMDGITRLVAHRTVADAEYETERSLLIVHFPPQNIVEEAFEDFTTGAWDAAPLQDKNKRSAHKMLAEARLSEPTRLVFDLKLKPEDRVLPFTTRELTRWADYGLVVTQRALPADTRLEQQLETIGIKPWSTRKEVFEAVSRSLVAPTLTETAIELPYRLILSPSSRARWITSDTPEMPSGVPSSGTYPLWNARLDPKGPRPDVRAVWARGLDRGFQRELKLQRDDNVDDAPWALDGATYKFQTSMNARHRREIMHLSSIYGLPALRRLVCKNPLNLDTCEDDENGQVVPVPPGYSFIDESRATNEGVFVPRPFANSAITLTSIGGILDTEQKWEPPAYYEDPNDRTVQNWTPAVNLQRFLYRSIPARDIRVEIEDKGFLFPLGHRAALLQITERKFLERGDPEGAIEKRGKGPTAYLLQRRFIVVDRPEKTFPALSQPFEGRPFPARKVTMITRATPPLAKPDTEKGGLLSASEGADFRVGLAFWPKRQMAGDHAVYPDVIWEYRINDDPTPARSRLLFVGNDMAHSPANVEALVAAYNAHVAADIDVPRERPVADRNVHRIPRFALTRDRNDDKDARTVSHGGARRTYAESAKSGDTSFETKTWLLAATGRKTGANAPTAARFTMDAYMEGADQPPFYPVEERGFLRIQPLERFLGRPDTIIETRISQVYIEHGFAANPAEAFLDVVAPPVYLDLNSNGTSSGGVAKPNSRVIALSRSRGPIGGKVPDAPEATTPEPATSTPLPERPTNAPWQQGQFDPADFFSDAKLLGLISLKDIIRVALFQAAPKLVETIETAVDENIAPRLHDAAALLMRALRPVQAGLAKEVVPGGPTTGQLYPGLSSKIAKLFQAAERLRDGLAPPRTDRSLQAAIEHASEVYRAVQDTLAEIEAIAASPLPAMAGDIVRDMLEALELLRNLIAGRTEAAIRAWVEVNVRDRVVRRVEELCQELRASLGGAELMRILFGGSETDDFCADVRWFLDLEPQAIQQRIASEAGRRIEEIDKQACLALLANTTVRGILDDLLNADEVDKACETPGGLGTLLDEALPRAARQHIERWLQALADTLFYEVFGRSVANLLSKIRRALTELHKAAREGHEQLTRAVFHLIEDVVRLALESSALTEVARAVEGVAQLCNRVLTRIESLARDTMAPVVELRAIIADRIEPHLVLAEQEVVKLPDTQRARAENALQGLRQGITQLNERLAELAEQRSYLPNSDSVCSDVAAQLNPVARVFDLRRDAVTAAQDVLGRLGTVVDVLALEEASTEAVPTVDQAKAARDAVGGAGLAVLDLIREVTAVKSLAGIARPESIAALRTLLNEMKAQAGAVRAAALEVEAALDAASKQSTGLLAAFETAATTWKAAIDAGRRDPKTLRPLADAVIAFAVEHDRRIAGLLARGVAIQAEARNKLESFASRLLAEIFDLIALLYAPAAKAAGALSAALFNSPNTSVAYYLKKALKDDIAELMQSDAAAMGREAARIEEVRNLAKSASRDQRIQAAERAAALLDSWQKDMPAVVRCIRDFAQLGELLLRGRFDALLDVDELRRELEEALLSFAPTTARLAYDFKTDVKPYKGLFAITEPRPGADLVLSTTVEVDLLKATRTVRASGRLQPFQVTLIPGFQAIQIDFSAATFHSVDGSAPRFDITVRKVRFLEKMKFVEALAAWLSGGGESGLYYDINLLTLTLEVGYRFPASVINLGYFQILNIGFSLSAVLPLGNSEALFRVAVSSREAPFLMVAPPYGGGGFIALTSNAEKLKIVEASFEFGAVMPINFGPLKGHGRVTAGIYFRSEQGSTVLEGFVQAIGEGSIACFTISVRLEVRMIARGGSATGTATFEFTFKVSFAEVSYAVSASYTYGGDGAGGSAMLPLETRFAALESKAIATDASSAFAAVAPRKPRVSAATRVHRTRVRVPRRDTEWAEYRKQYRHLARELI
jgi:hypothetical protein